MPSPFPGMDPYLEAHWGDVHSRLVIYAADQLQGTLPDTLRARVEERVFVESPLDGGRSIFPDVRVVERRPAEPGPTSGGGVATAVAPLAEPVVLHFPSEEITETFIEIIDVGSGNRVVTVIEFLSPANKQPGPGQKLYLRKQDELRAGGVNLVEIDLLRAGQRIVVARPEGTPPQYRSTYLVSVWRAVRPWHPEIYPMSLRQPLPAFRVPLRESDEDVRLDLQRLIVQCYRNGAYDDLDYRADPDPPLSPEDAAWADALLREQRRR
jgi:hypothetical protein